MRFVFTIALFTFMAGNLWAADARFKKVLIIVFENTDYSEAIKQPYLNQLAKEGANFTNLHAETHPSQPNYIALVAGDLHGVKSNKDYNLNVTHVGDLLEAKGLEWKMYAEGYPGGCSLVSENGDYARKHAPFISFTNIQKNPGRCKRIVDEVQFDADVKADALPDYSFYVPDQKNDGHDTGIGYGDRWLKTKFGPLFSNPIFMKDLLVILTFDEDGGSKNNLIYNVLLGDMIKPGSTVSVLHDHYSLLRLIEDEFGLGNLGRKDATASAIEGIWK